MSDPRVNAAAGAGPAAPVEAWEPQPILSELVPFLLALWRRKWIILAVVATTLFVAVLYLLRATPIYRGESELYVERTTPNILDKDIFSSTLEQRNFLGSQSEILRSVRIINAVLANLEREGMDPPSIRKLRQSAPNLAEAVIQNLSVKLKRDTNVLSVAYESPDPEDAALIVNEIVRAYTSYHLEQEKSTSAGVLPKLTEQREKLVQELDQEEKKLLDFLAKESVTYFTEEGFETILQHLSALRASLTQAELESVTSTLRHTQLQAVGEDPARVWEFIGGEDMWSREFAASPAVIEARRLRQQISEARAQLALLGGGAAGEALPAIRGTSARYQAAEQALLQAKLALAALREQNIGDGHPMIAEARAKIGRLEEERRGAIEEDRLAAERNVQALELEYRAAVRELAETLVSAAKNEVELRRKKVESLQSLLDRETNDTRELRRKAMEYSRYKDNVDRAKKLHDVIVDRIKELSLSQEYGRVNVSILRAAEPPKSPVKPRTTLVLALALVLGLMLGGFVASLVEHFDVRVRDPEEIGQVLAVPTLGVVPAVHPEGSDVEKLRAIGLAAWKSPTSQLAESYRRVRTAIDFGAAPENTRKILVTSAIPGDGKTTLASNLAASMALNGKRVLLVDSDLRWPRLNKLFGVYRKEGLTDVLVGEATLEDAIFQTEIPNLDLLPCGTRPPNPAELLGSNAFRELVRRLESAYDRIIFDSSPLMAVADAQILAAVADQTVLVSRLSQAERPLFAKVRKMLADVGRQPMGMVVNVVEARRKGYYGAYDYGKYYRKYYGRYGGEAYGEQPGGVESGEAAEPEGGAEAPRSSARKRRGSRETG